MPTDGSSYEQSSQVLGLGFRMLAERMPLASLLLRWERYEERPGPAATQSWVHIVNILSPFRFSELGNESPPGPNRCNFHDLFHLR